jgi:ribosomal protein S25
MRFVERPQRTGLVAAGGGLSAGKVASLKAACDEKMARLPAVLKAGDGFKVCLHGYFEASVNAAVSVVDLEGRLWPLAEGVQVTQRSADVTVLSGKGRRMPDVEPDNAAGNKHRDERLAAELAAGLRLVDLPPLPEDRPHDEAGAGEEAGAGAEDETERRVCAEKNFFRRIGPELGWQVKHSDSLITSMRDLLGDAPDLEAALPHVALLCGKLSALPEIAEETVEEGMLASVREEVAGLLPKCQMMFDMMQAAVALSEEAGGKAKKSGGSAGKAKSAGAGGKAKGAGAPPMVAELTEEELAGLRKESGGDPFTVLEQLGQQMKRLKPLVAHAVLRILAQRGEEPRFVVSVTKVHPATFHWSVLSIPLASARDGTSQWSWVAPCAESCHAWLSHAAALPPSARFTEDWSIQAARRLPAFLGVESSLDWSRVAASAGGGEDMAASGAGARPGAPPWRRDFMINGARYPDGWA